VITLKTLPFATKQEVFEQVARHLLEQKQQSLIGNYKCAYRGEAGLKCAAGCLIGDDEYRGIFENRNWSFLVREGHVPKEHSALISLLQSIHDDTGPAIWESSLKLLAKDLGLAWAGAARAARREF
jgi:hypothetical protein